MYKLTSFGIIKVSGSDAQKFLQGQLSCDVNALQPQQSCLGAYCSIKGKVVSLFRLWCSTDAYYMRLQKSCIVATINELQKYAVFSKVLIEDVSEQLYGIGIENSEINFSDLPPTLYVLPITKQRYEIYGNRNDLNAFCQTYLPDKVVNNEANWDILDIQDGLPEIYPATVGEFFAHDLNLPALNAVSFTKGCFRGQEIVARMQHRGNLKRHLHKFQIAAVIEVEPGEVITAAENSAGIVVRSAILPDSQTIGLAVFTDSYLQNDMYLKNHLLTIFQ